jgi:hypothetical protein
MHLSRTRVSTHTGVNHSGSLPPPIAKGRQTIYRGNCSKHGAKWLVSAILCLLAAEYRLIGIYRDTHKDHNQLRN